MLLTANGSTHNKGRLSGCAPALGQLLWEDRCPEEIRHWMLPSSIRSLVVAELELNYLIGAGGRSNFARILQLFKSVDTLRLEFPNAQVRIYGISTDLVKRT